MRQIIRNGWFWIAVSVVFLGAAFFVVIPKGKAPEKTVVAEVRATVTVTLSPSATATKTQMATKTSTATRTATATRTPTETRLPTETRAPTVTATTVPPTVTRVSTMAPTLPPAISQPIAAPAKIVEGSLDKKDCRDWATGKYWAKGEFTPAGYECLGNNLWKIPEKRSYGDIAPGMP